ncbi:Metallo-dependent phosphatase-like protein [Cokeromyces recurvatus]|uniref:Metallo-dependent phosphatase-like protein n=1 Tax=Cokeromyces recurvatus TaxID=90255 RepID=UPI002220BB1E|nr:Metallo-dependent phosphatase-like protein [Cokeromyces recurvatus]KAI7899685.1 Metallo-dependent phosphatase-like protein [Cokeromyces recurvatus]
MYLKIVFNWIFICLLSCQCGPFVHAVAAKEFNSQKKHDKLFGKFLHITDIHIDPLYLEGSDPSRICHTITGNGSEITGKFGALGTRCASPVPLVDATFKFLKKEINQIDFIIYTGDTVRQNRDANLPVTHDQVIKGHTLVAEYVLKSFPKGTLFFPTIGNNDAFMYNQLEENDPLFPILETIWKPFKLDLTETFTKGGYFIQEIIKNKLSIISLNSMFFYNPNLAVEDCISSTSPGTIQLEWLETQLKKLKKKDGKHQAYIIGHISPIDEYGIRILKDACYEKYFALLGKYGKYIAGHFTGHTNADTLNAVIPNGNGSYGFIAADDQYAIEQKENLKMSIVPLFNAPSIIPSNNPAVRVYDYETTHDGKYPIGTIRDWDQYYVDLIKANEKRTVKFKLEYTASDLYHVHYFDGKGLGKAVLNVATNENARQRYQRYFNVST